jgi:hypothetical protein
MSQQQFYTQLPPSNPVPDSIFRLVQTSVPPLTCMLCEQLYDQPHTFQSCGCTFCWRCVTATMEGKGINKSQCPACKMPAWKKDLRKNCTYETAIETIMKAKHLSQQAALSSGPTARDQSPPPDHVQNDPDAPQIGSSCALNYSTFHDLLAQMIVSEFNSDKIRPLQDGTRSPFLVSLEEMARLRPPVLTRSDKTQLLSELVTLEGWLKETDALIESKEKMQLDAERRDVEMLQLLGGNNSDNATDHPASKQPLRPSSSPVRGIALTCADSPDFKSKMDLLTQLLLSNEGSKGVKVSKEVNERTSHLIVGGLDENKIAKFRSRSFLLGILRGCWILSPDWVDACLESGCIVDEAEFEVKGDLHALGGPEKGRTARSTSYSYQDMSKPSLFSSLKVRLIKRLWPVDQIKNYEAVEKVLLAGGATVVGEEDREGLFVTVVYSMRVNSGASASMDDPMPAEGEHWVGYRWVFDSISHFDRLEFDKYTKT